MALAYFMTWSCHGSWLPGDARGSVDKVHHEYGAPYAPASTEREKTNRIGARVQMLEAEERAVVRRAILDHCAIKGWKLLALNVRSSHVHLVVSRVALSPEAAMGQFKCMGDTAAARGRMAWRRARVDARGEHAASVYGGKRGPRGAVRAGWAGGGTEES